MSPTRAAAPPQPSTDARERRPSPVTERAVAFVAERRPAAEALGRELADHVSDPEAFARRLRAGLRDLSDPEYLEGSRRIAPGIGALFGVRWPLLAGVERSFRAATRRGRPAGFLELADRLFRELELEPRWLAFDLLDRLVVVDPERAWQLLRRAAREAGDWITVDSLAHPVGRGILSEPYRWAELEQLVFSPSRWERRLVGSTVATMPFVDRRRGRQPEVAVHGLGLIGDLLGDSEPDVQKALAWALRSLVLVDAPAVSAFVAREADAAAEARDGQRAWVLRDALIKLPPDDAARIRARLEGIRRTAGGSSTSRAAAIATRFAGDARPPDPRIHP